MKLLAIVAILLVGAVLAYLVIYPTTSYRFRITLNFDTPQGPRSGSSVMEVRTRRYPAWTTFGNNTGQSSLTGEAVFVDLGPGDDGRAGNVVALLALGPRGEDVDFYLLPGKAFEPLWKKKLGTPEFRGTSWELPKLPPGTKTALHGDLIPTLMTFADLKDPASARVVLPDDLPQSLGQGVALHDVTLEMVAAGTWPLTLFGIGGEPITRGIEQKLLWWNKPLPWLQPIGSGVYVDTRRDGLRLSKEQFKKGT
jgi:hypothetical protein